MHLIKQQIVSSSTQDLVQTTNSRPTPVAKSTFSLGPQSYNLHFLMRWNNHNDV